MIASTRQLSKTASFQIPEINWRMFCIFGIAIVSVSLFFSIIFYVFQVNDLTRGSYVIKSYEKNIANLSDDNAKLETAFAEAGFLGNVSQKAVTLNFEKIKDIKYIQVLSTSLAKAQ